MFFKKLIITAITTLSFVSSIASADTEKDADFTDSVLTVPRVIVGDTLFENVRLQLDFSGNSFSLLGAEKRSRFSSKTVGIDEVLTDHNANLTWVNGSHGCHINADAAQTATTDVVEHCESLEFAGQTDWRAPTTAEISELTIHANHMNVKLNYRNPNCQFMAASDGFVQTENNKEPGKIVESAVNSGSRCVR
jgi:hypothetical protein